MTGVEEKRVEEKRGREIAAWGEKNASTSALERNMQATSRRETESDMFYADLARAEGGRRKGDIHAFLGRY
jgi:hypothetical protein